MTQITFVCTGNTCRSPMAEGIFKKMLNDRNITDISCISCGLSAYSGDNASYKSVSACKKYNVDISKHRARQINIYIMEQTDIMVCMTNSHKGAVMSFNPDFPIFVPAVEIDDPYGQDKEAYLKCAEQIYCFCEKFLDSLLSEISPMNKEDILQIAEIEKECFSAPWTKEALTDELNNNTSHFLVCKYDEKVLAYIGVNEVCDEAYIDNIAVKKEYRRFHIAENLLKKAQNDAFGRGCRFISLEVRKSNIEAVALYKKLGYNTVGERKNFYTNPNEDALIMTLYKDDVNENTIS